MWLVSLASRRQISRNLGQIVLKPKWLTGKQLEAMCVVAFVNVVFAPPHHHATAKPTCILELLSFSFSLYVSVYICGSD